MPDTTGFGGMLEWQASAIAGLCRRHRNFTSLSIHLTSEPPVMRKALLFLALLSAPFACLSAPPSGESIETLFAVTKVESTMNSMYGQMEQMMRQAMAQATKGKTLTEDQRRAIDAAPKQFVAVMKDELSWASMKPVYVNIYRDTFTQEEVDGMIVFYRSPAGAAFIEKMPLVMQKTNVVMQSRLPALLDKMKAAMTKTFSDARIPR